MSRIYRTVPPGIQYEVMFKVRYVESMVFKSFEIIRRKTVETKLDD